MDDYEYFSSGSQREPSQRRGKSRKRKSCELEVGKRAKRRVGTPTSVPVPVPVPHHLSTYPTTFVPQYPQHQPCHSLKSFITAFASTSGNGHGYGGRLSDADVDCAWLPSSFGFSPSPPDPCWSESSSSSPSRLSAASFSLSPASVSSSSSPSTSSASSFQSSESKGSGQRRNVDATRTRLSRTEKATPPPSRSRSRSKLDSTSPCTCGRTRAHTSGVQRTSTFLSTSPIGNLTSVVESPREASPFEVDDLELLGEGLHFTVSSYDNDNVNNNSSTSGHDDEYRYDNNYENETEPEFVYDYSPFYPNHQTHHHNHCHCQTVRQQTPTSSSSASTTLAPSITAATTKTRSGSRLTSLQSPLGRLLPASLLILLASSSLPTSSFVFAFASAAPTSSYPLTSSSHPPSSLSSDTFDSSSFSNSNSRLDENHTSKRDQLENPRLGSGFGHKKNHFLRNKRRYVDGMLVISSSKFRNVNANANDYSVSISISGTGTGSSHALGSVPPPTTLAGEKKQEDFLGSGVDGEGRFDMKESRLESTSPQQRYPYVHVPRHSDSEPSGAAAVLVTERGTGRAHKRVADAGEGQSEQSPSPSGGFVVPSGLDYELVGPDGSGAASELDSEKRNVVEDDGELVFSEVEVGYFGACCYNGNGHGQRASIGDGLGLDSGLGHTNGPNSSGTFRIDGVLAYNCNCCNEEQEQEKEMITQMQCGEEEDDHDRDRYDSFPDRNVNVGLMVDECYERGRGAAKVVNVNGNVLRHAFSDMDNLSGRDGFSKPFLLKVSEDQRQSRVGPNFSPVGLGKRHSGLLVEGSERFDRRQDTSTSAAAAPTPLSSSSSESISQGAESESVSDSTSLVQTTPIAPGSTSASAPDSSSVLDPILTLFSSSTPVSLIPTSTTTEGTTAFPPSASVTDSDPVAVASPSSTQGSASGLTSASTTTADGTPTPTSSMDPGTSASASSSSSDSPNDPSPSSSSSSSSLPSPTTTSSAMSSSSFSSGPSTSASATDPTTAQSSASPTSRTSDSSSQPDSTASSSSAPTSASSSSASTSVSVTVGPSSSTTSSDTSTSVSESTSRSSDSSTLSSSSSTSRSESSSSSSSSISTSSSDPTSSSASPTRTSTRTSSTSSSSSSRSTTSTRTTRSGFSHSEFTTEFTTVATFTSTFTTTRFSTATETNSSGIFTTLVPITSTGTSTVTTTSSGTTVLATDIPAPFGGNGSSLSLGAIVGLAVGGAVVLLIIVLGIWWVLCWKPARRRKRKSSGLWGVGGPVGAGGGSGGAREISMADPPPVAGPSAGAGGLAGVLGAAGSIFRGKSAQSASSRHGLMNTRQWSNASSMGHWKSPLSGEDDDEETGIGPHMDLGSGAAVGMGDAISSSGHGHPASSNSHGHGTSGSSSGHGHMATYPTFLSSASPTLATPVDAVTTIHGQKQQYQSIHAISSAGLSTESQHSLSPTSPDFIRPPPAPILAPAAGTGSGSGSGSGSGQSQAASHELSSATSHGHGTPGFYSTTPELSPSGSSSGHDHSYSGHGSILTPRVRILEASPPPSAFSTPVVGHKNHRKSLSLRNPDPYPLDTPEPLHGGSYLEVNANAMAPSIHSLEPVPIVDINLATANALHPPTSYHPIAISSRLSSHHSDHSGDHSSSEAVGSNSSSAGDLTESKRTRSFKSLLGRLRAKTAYDTGSEDIADTPPPSYFIPASTQYPFPLVPNPASLLNPPLTLEELSSSPQVVVDDRLIDGVHAVPVSGSGNDALIVGASRVWPQVQTTLPVFTSPNLVEESERVPEGLLNPNLKDADKAVRRESRWGRYGGRIWGQSGDGSKAERVQDKGKGKQRDEHVNDGWMGGVDDAGSIERTPSFSTVSLRDNVDYSRPFAGLVLNRLGSSTTFTTQDTRDTRLPGSAAVTPLEAPTMSFHRRTPSGSSRAESPNEEYPFAR
ncbi:hypothetical protein VKT23_010142 [Stygiomarasmius scandens]|uniref:Uncharacterized protein n=1 Tax=Marasmiellus scandens TaxID=2682957 RepID=A0ABR1JD53_9AGAR